LESIQIAHELIQLQQLLTPRVRLPPPLLSVLFIIAPSSFTMAPLNNNLKRTLSTVSTQPNVEYNSEDDITSISCEGCLSDRTEAYINENVTIPITFYEDPFDDITVQFDYDANFQNGVDEAIAIQEVKNSILLSVMKQSPLLIDNGITVTPTDVTCDTLLDDTFRSKLESYGIIRRFLRRLSDTTDIADDEWDYYMGWKNQPDDVHSDHATVCDVSSVPTDALSSYCKPITSSLTAQVPKARDLDNIIVQQQILEFIRNGFDQNEYITDSVTSMKFLGARNLFSSDPTDVMSDNKTNRFRESAAKLMTKFGISATALLGFVTLFSCGVFGYKVKSNRSRSSKSTHTRSKYLSSKSEDSDKEQPLSRAIYTHYSTDAVEIVDVGVNQDGLMNGKFVEGFEESNQEGDVQTGFDGVSLNGWMESLRDDADSCVGSSVLDNIGLEEEDDDDDDELLGESVGDQSLDTADQDDSTVDHDDDTTYYEDHSVSVATSQNNSFFQEPISPTRVRSTFNRLF
jgi:hypothetical protein